MRVYDVPEISCEHCKRAIEDAVSKVAAVSDVVVAIDAKQVRVSGSATDADIKAAITDAGYEVTGSHVAAE